MDRKDIDKKYKWDLESIYKNDEEYNKDLEEFKEIGNKLCKYEGKVLDNAKNLLEVLKLDTECERLIDKLYTFSHLNYDLDTRNGKNLSRFNTLMDEYSRVNTMTSFVSTELSKLTHDKLNEFIKEEPELKAYRFNLEKIIKQSKYILSLESEKLLSTLSPILDEGAEVFDKIDNADINLGEVEDKDGKKLKLTSGSYGEFVRSSDRVLRKNAVYKMHEYYKNHENSISECLYNHVKTDSIITKLRGYNSSLEASLMHDDISVDFYKKVIEDTHKNLPVLHRMMNVYKKALGVDKMHIYDINARLGKLKDKNYSIEEINDTIKKALEIMGPKYMEVVNKAFNENWVDYYETTGKASGAYSSGCYDSKAYILLNYTGKFDDVETLAHELGHSIHSYYSKKERGPIDYQYPIFLAEIASTTHEILLNDYLLKNAKDNETKKYILNNILSGYKSTVFRQVEFAEFEYIIHDRIEKGENLTKEDFTNIYLELQNKYYGKDIINDEIIKYECLRIPHFYSSFYVYKYATSLCIAYHFASDIINKKEGAVDNYIKLISSGGKDYPFKILKECGIDLEKEDIMNYSLTLINKYIDELESITNERS